MASLSLFHLRAIFYGANIGIYFIAPKKTTIFFSHTAINFKSSSTPTQRKRPLQPPIVRPRTAHLPRCASARRAPRRNRAAQSPGRPCARSRNAVPTEKRRSKRLRPWALFRLIGELFADRLHRVRPPTPPQEARAEEPAKKLSRAHAHITEFLFFSFTHRQ